jgi:hypothetical protein
MQIEARALQQELLSRAGVPVKDLITYLQNMVEQGDMSKASLLGFLFSGFMEGIPHDPKKAADYTLQGAQNGVWPQPRHGAKLLDANNLPQFL